MPDVNRQLWTTGSHLPRRVYGMDRYPQARPIPRGELAMTIARTPSGEVLGQVTTIAAPAGSLVLLASGRYVTVSLASVRLEEV